MGSGPRMTAGLRGFRTVRAGGEKFCCRGRVRAGTDTPATVIWQTNAHRLAARTMFTLFFAGETFAPRCEIDGVNIQRWLQARYRAAYAQWVPGRVEGGSGRTLMRSVRPAWQRRYAMRGICWTRS